jgi:hypothetical protein
MQKNILIAITILLSSSYLSAQHYKTAAGIRLNNGIGVTVQQVVKEKMTIEGIFSTSKKSDNYHFAALLERHFNVLTRRTNVYAGGGGHFGLLKEQKVGYGNTVGVSGVFGAELTIRRLNFSLDYQPAINLIKGENQDRFVGQFGLSARYVFVEREKLGERIKKRFKRKT